MEFADVSIVELESPPPPVDDSVRYGSSWIAEASDRRVNDSFSRAVIFADKLDCLVAPLVTTPTKGCCSLICCKESPSFKEC
jgi:hypothetical protein